jgi:hypothetical protein
MTRKRPAAAIGELAGAAAPTRLDVRPNRQSFRIRICLKATLGFALQYYDTDEISLSLNCPASGSVARKPLAATVQAVSPIVAGLLPRR